MLSVEFDRTVRLTGIGDSLRDILDRGGLGRLVCYGHRARWQTSPAVVTLASAGWIACGVDQSR